MFVVFPKEKLGIGMLTLSDVAGNEFNASAVQQAYDYWVKDPAADAAAAHRIAAFHEDAIQSATDLVKPPKPSIAVSPATLRQYEGRYHNDRLGTMVVRLENDRLRAHLGEFTLELLRPERTNSKTRADWSLRSSRRFCPGPRWEDHHLHVGRARI